MRKTIISTMIVTFGLMLTLLQMQGCANFPDQSGGRMKEGLTDWQFCQDTSLEGSEIVIPNDVDWTTIQIPHCFRLSGLPEQSAGFYRRTFTATEGNGNKCFYLFLEGAGSVVDVFVNGQHVGQHKGAYTAAAFDLTPAIRFGAENELVLRVTNRDDEAANCLSQSNLFYTNGGLYRPAWLITTQAVHIFPDMGSPGVYLTPKNISKESADLEVKTYVRNSLEKAVKAVVRNTVFDPDGTEIAQFKESATIPANSNTVISSQTHMVNPKLWDSHQGNLYTVRSEVLVGGKVADAITEHTGIRTVEMKNNRILLNGKELLARGVCKHQQDEHVWNAEDDKLLKWEMDGMLDLGVNTIRLAHYPHRHFEYNMADESGIAVWAENGLAGQKWDKKVKRETKPTADGERITREMVLQNWNHPCIIFWSSGNETYQEVASHYADVIRSLDQSRLITYASAGERPSNVDFVAGNTYQGWYYEHFSDFTQLPKNAFLSETGAGSWITQHIPYNKVKTTRKVWSVDQFEPEEYCELFAEFRFQTIFRNNPEGYKLFLWWNYREFYDRKFKKNRNTKGILTLAGMPKDYYYLYQSFLRPDHPVLHLCGRHHFYRQFAPDNGIKVYSNANRVELFINGQSQGVKSNGRYVQPDTLKEEGGRNASVKGIGIDNVFFWKVPLEPGKNVVKVRDDRGNSQSMVIYQKPMEGSTPVTEGSLVVDLKSSNENNPAIFIDRPVEAQGPFYSEVDGSSDNTFDALPSEIEGARWITTKRLSDEENKTDLSFRVTQPATVFVMYSTGTFPAHTLHTPDPDMMQASAALIISLAKDGFADTGSKGTWRRHSLWLANYGLMSRPVKAGDTISIPGQTLDYVVLIKPLQ